MTGAQLLQMFVRKKKEGYQDDCSTPTSSPMNLDPLSMFSKRATKLVPNNSEADSDD